MTTHGGAVPTQQNCPSCNALVYYEGHSELASNLVPHRFHCHSCGGIYLVRSTSHRPPKFRITQRHAAAPADMATADAIARQEQDHDHGDEEHDHDYEGPSLGPIGGFAPPAELTDDIEDDSLSDDAEESGAAAEDAPDDGSGRTE